MAKQIAVLSVAVGEINNLTTRMSALETKQELQDHRLVETAAFIINQFNEPKELNNFPASKAIVRIVCNSKNLKTLLVSRVGTNIVTEYCNFVNK